MESDDVEVGEAGEHRTEIISGDQISKVRRESFQGELLDSGEFVFYGLHPDRKVLEVWAV